MRLGLGFMASVFAQHRVTFQPPESGGQYVDGRWEPAAKPEPVTELVTVLPITGYDLQYFEGGTYTTEDVKIIAKASLELPVQTRFSFSGAEFEVREERDYARVAGLRRYVAKRLLEGGE